MNSNNLVFGSSYCLITEKEVENLKSSNNQLRLDSETLRKELSILRSEMEMHYSQGCLLTNHQFKLKTEVKQEEENEDETKLKNLEMINPCLS